MKGLNELNAPLIIVLFIIVGLGIVATCAIYFNPTRTSEIITLCFTAIIAIATLFYAILTTLLVSETKKTHEVLTNPKILVEVQPRFMLPPDPRREEEYVLELSRDPNIDLKKSRIEFELIFRNIGLGPAYDIKPKIIEIKDIKIDKPNENPIILDYLKKLINVLSERLPRLRPFERDILYIAPNDKRSFFLGNVTVIPDYVTLAEYLDNYAVKIEVDYHKYPEDKRKVSEKPFTDTYLIDFSYLTELISNIVRADNQQSELLAKGVK